jgi:hypothetical protein
MSYLTVTWKLYKWPRAAVETTMFILKIMFQLKKINNTELDVKAILNGEKIKGKGAFMGYF